MTLVPFLAKDILAAHGADPFAKAAFISSGVADEFLGAVTAFRQAGEPGLTDTNHLTLCMSLASLAICAGEPQLHAKLHGAAMALDYCLDHSLDNVKELGTTSGAHAAELCARLFGRMEAGSGVSFRSSHVDDLCAATCLRRS